VVNRNSIFGPKADAQVPGIEWLVSAKSSHSIHSENGAAKADKGQKLKYLALVRLRDSDIGTNPCSFQHFFTMVARSRLLLLTLHVCWSQLDSLTTKRGTQ
jgi:hypothetical protein